MCGKDPVSRAAIARAIGSPPHVRERLGLRGCGIQNVRITPACAGKTEITTEGFTDGGDHPRMCGKDS